MHQVMARGAKKCGLLRQASSCLRRRRMSDASCDQDTTHHGGDIPALTPTPHSRPSKMARHSSTDPSTSFTATSLSPHASHVSSSATREPHASSSDGSASTTRSTKPTPQPQSPFFARLPIEIRRLIYDHLFRSTNPIMKTHLHAACDSAPLRLTTTPCRYTPSATYSTRDDDEDPMRTDPWPGWRGRNQPPRWFWHAWGLRMRWGPHWKCQEARMLDWRTRSDGTSEDLSGREGGWMGAFLGCRLMYDEAIEYFFEFTSLIFTASEDAYRFFLLTPHSHMAKIRNLDLSFDHFKDHLFLKRIESHHPHLPNGSSAPVAEELWVPLMECVREQLPELRSLRIHMSAPSASQGQVYMDLLRDWERSGLGWVEEQMDGMVYLEKGRRPKVVAEGAHSSEDTGDESSNSMIGSYGA